MAGVTMCFLLCNPGRIVRSGFLEAGERVELRMYQTDYDELFRIMARLYFSDVPIDDAHPFDWRWLKAQAIAESALNPKAKSPVGAMGLMQLMPKTSAECARALYLPNLPWDPQTNIHFGAFYLKRMWSIFAAETGMERLRFAWGAYNAGLGNIIKAQRIASSRGLATYKWASIAACLPAVTGRHAQETIGYVARIERIYERLKG